MATMQADFSELPRHLRERAARYLSYLQRYLAALPALLHATRLEARTRLVEDPASGPGGSSHRRGWVGWSQGEIKRQQEPDWDDTAPGITHISLPAEDEPDPQDEEADGDMPGSTRDSAIELYDPLEAIKVMSRMRFRRLYLELRSQEFMWSLDIASRMERTQALRAAQSNIDVYLTGTPRMILRSIWIASQRSCLSMCSALGSGLCRACAQRQRNDLRAQEADTRRCHRSD